MRCGLRHRWSGHIKCGDDPQDNLYKRHCYKCDLYQYFRAYEKGKYIKFKFSFAFDPEHPDKPLNE